MKKINTRQMWSLSLLVIGLCTIIIGLTGMTDIRYKGLILGLVGAMDMTALIALLYATILLIKRRRRRS